MSARSLGAAGAFLLLLGACSTTAQNPNYEYSTKYQGSSGQYPTAQYKADSPHQNASYTSSTALSYPAPVVFVQDVEYADTTAVTQAASYEAPTTYQTAGREFVPVATYTRVNSMCLSENASSYNLEASGISCDPVQVVIPGQSAVITAAYNGSGATEAHTLYADSTTTTVVTQSVPTRQPVTSLVAPTDQYYGDSYGTPGYHAVMAANAAEIEEIAEAERLTHGAPKTITARTVTQSLGAAANIHEVVEGNTVYSLARERCIKVDDIKELNGLDDSYSIRLGDHIKLPATRC